MLIYSALGAAILALAHFFAYKLHFSHIPRSKWLSAAGGISVAYVFIHLLPELKEWQEMFNDKHQDVLPFLKHHLYLIALLGLALFYGLERAAKLSGPSHRKDETEENTANKENSHVFHLHIATFCLYNALIGYLLVHRDTTSVQGLVLFVVAMIFHFTVNDYSLLDHYRSEYLHRGRYFVTVAVLGGWVVGYFTQVSQIVVAILFSLIAGSIILNVLKEELPEERKSNFWAFLSGVVLYSFLLLSV